MSDFDVSATRSVSLNYTIPAPALMTYGYYTGTLPPGLSLSTATGGVLLSGTPSTGGGGVYDFTVHWNGSGTTSSNTVTVTVTDPSALQAPVITCVGATTTSGGGTLTLPAGSIALQFTATNNGKDWAYGLPSGLSQTGGTVYSLLTVSGSLLAGNYTVTAACTNVAWSSGTTQTSSYILALTVEPAVPVITLPTGTALNSYVGKAVSAQFSVQTYAGNCTWSASNLPPGCSINPGTGLVSGIPTTAGLYHASITAANSKGTTPITVDFAITAATPPPTITCSNATANAEGGSLTVTAGQVNLQFVAQNGGSSWTAALPSGLTLNATYGSVTGTLAPGNYQVLAQCSNTAYPSGPTQPAQYLLLLTAAPAVPVISTSASSGLTGTQGQTVSMQFTVQAAAGTCTWSATGLPPGCSINASTGAVAGVPTFPGTFHASITATNSADQSSTYSALFVIAASGGSGATVAPSYPFLQDDPTLVGVIVETSTGAVSLSRSTPLKAGTVARFAFVFLKNGTQVDPPAAATVKMAVRPKGKYKEERIFDYPAAVLNEASGENPAWLLYAIPLTGEALTKELAPKLDSEADPVVLDVMSDIRFRISDERDCSSARFDWQISPRVTTS